MAGGIGVGLDETHEEAHHQRRQENATACHQGHGMVLDMRKNGRGVGISLVFSFFFHGLSMVF